MSKSTTESELAKILGTLGNKDAIKILRIAKTGFDSSADMHKKLGLSIKRYYYRLKKLMDADLITKRNNRYELTLLGEMVCDSIERKVLWAIENIDHVRIVDTLRTSEIDDETWRDVAVTVFGDKLQNLAGDVRVIRNYEGLVETTYRLIEDCKKSFYLATRYTDARCVEAGWRALSRGVEMWIVDGDIALLNGRMKMLRMVISHPRAIKAFDELWHSSASHIRYREVPFSFMVVDQKVACFEVLNPAIQGFFSAIKLENKEVCDKLVKTFNNLWEGAGEDPLKGLSVDLMSRLRKSRRR